MAYSLSVEPIDWSVGNEQVGGGRRVVGRCPSLMANVGRNV